MKYYSEITGEIFDTVDELLTAEKNIEALKSKAKAEYEAAFNEAVEAYKNAFNKYMEYKPFMNDNDEDEEECDIHIFFQLEKE